MQVSDYIVKKYGRTTFPSQELLDGKDPAEISTCDLLAVVLGSGSKHESVFSLSERIIRDYGSDYIFKIKDPKRLDQMLKIGPRKAAKIVAAFELGRRMINPPNNKLLIRGPEDVYRAYKHMASHIKESFVGLYLNTRNIVINDEVISIGHLTGALVHPREVFKPAVDYSANSIIVVHNHPSGEFEPSKNDDEITKLLKETGEILQIPVTDHLIIAENGYYSYNKEGRL